MKRDHVEIDMKNLNRSNVAILAGVGFFARPAHPTCPPGSADSFASPAHRCALRFAATESGVRLVQKICAAPKVLGSPILAQFLGGTGPTAAGGS